MPDASVADPLGAIAPKAVSFLGKCGGLKRKNQIGDLILPIAAIRGEGIRRQNVDIDVLVFRDLQQLRGFPIDICQILQNMNRLFE